MKRLRTLKLFQILRTKIKKVKNLYRFMSFSRPLQWCHSHADPIWQDGTLKAYSRESSFFHIKSKYLCFISRFYYAIVAAYLNCTITFLVEHVASFPKFLF
jgi:hypothetical protein